jgi:hypothetical protein
MLRLLTVIFWRANQGAAANRRPARRSEGSGNLPAIVAADRAFPAAVAELGSLGHFVRHAKIHSHRSRTEPIDRG